MASQFRSSTGGEFFEGTVNYLKENEPIKMLLET